MVIKVPVSESLEEIFSAVTGKELRLLDPFQKNASAVTWVTAGSNIEAFCAALQRQLGDSSYATLPPPEWVRANGGLIAHLSIAELGSGLVSAVVHNEDHNVLFYGKQIFECRGMSGGQPMISYPFSLQNLTVNGLIISIEPGSIKIDDSNLPAYTTEGLKAVRLQGNSGGEASLNYSLVRAITPDLGSLPPLLTSLEVSAETSSDRFKLSVTTTAVGLYEVKLASGPVTFHFGAEGKVVRVTSAERTEDRVTERVIEPSKWGLVFTSCFYQRAEPPTLDVQSTILGMIRPFTNHSLALPGHSSSQPEKSLLDRFVMYKQEMPQQTF